MTKVVKTYTLANETEARYVLEAVNYEVYMQKIGNKYTLNGDGRSPLTCTFGSSSILPSYQTAMLP